MADDIVIRLVLNADAIQREQPMSAERHREAAEEIKRLRAAGDEFANATLDVSCSGLPEQLERLVAAFDAWQEARRG